MKLLTNTAEDTGSFRVLRKRYSVRKPTAWEMARITRLRQPKKYTDATTAGIRAYTTRTMGGCHWMSFWLLASAIGEHLH
jgi:hypothetical protein